MIGLIFSSLVIWEAQLLTYLLKLHKKYDNVITFFKGMKKMHSKEEYSLLGMKSICDIAKSFDTFIFNIMLLHRILILYII